MYFLEQNFLQICVPSCLSYPSAIFQLSLMSPMVLLLGEHKQTLSPARSGVPAAWVSSSCQVINNVCFSDSGITKLGSFVAWP